MDKVSGRRAKDELIAQGSQGIDTLSGCSLGFLVLEQAADE
ncbi:hypothetical protein [Paenibacillus aquistagni]|nr:hypothetical protein [Paenibacillus aquistagni]